MQAQLGSRERRLGCPLTPIMGSGRARRLPREETYCLGGIHWPIRYIKIAKALMCESYGRKKRGAAHFWTHLCTRIKPRLFFSCNYYFVLRYFPSIPIFFAIRSPAHHFVHFCPISSADTKYSADRVADQGNTYQRNNYQYGHSSPPLCTNFTRMTIFASSQVAGM